jgi:NAD(P)-dependent dehydrogenase (short-subunit alcohol dehydrogenase family)
MRFDGKVAIVTGGASGIGLAAVRLLGARGAKVAVADVDDPQHVVDELTGSGVEALAVQADVSVDADVRRMVRHVVDRFGRLDIVMANAGINGVWAPLEEITESEYDRTMNVNLKGTFLTIKYCVEPMRASGGGAVVITSSINGVEVFSNCGASVYAASKAAQAALGKMLACELGQYGIRVNTICPGYTATSIGENTFARNIGRISWRIDYPRGSSALKGDDPAPADDVAELMLYLASEPARFITGQVITIDGGEALLQG